MSTRKTFLPLVAGLAVAVPTVAAAQTTPVPLGLRQAMPGGLAATEGGEVVQGSVTLAAVLRNGDDPIAEGLAWHVFERKGTAAGELVAARQGGTQNLRLRSGDYVAHVAYGRASAVQTFTVSSDGAALDPIVLDAGAVRLSAEAGGNPIASDSDVRFSIYEVAGNERRLILPDVPPGETVRVARGLYRVVAQYGPINAVAGADIRVRTGEVTEATLGVPGAEVTLELVAAEGRAPLASTAWRVFDGDGKPLFESDEPSPKLILAAGSYTTEALHDGRTVRHAFDVSAGENAKVSVPLE